MWTQRDIFDALRGTSERSQRSRPQPARRETRETERRRLKGDPVRVAGGISCLWHGYAERLEQGVFVGTREWPWQSLIASIKRLAGRFDGIGRATPGAHQVESDPQTHADQPLVVLTLRSAAERSITPGNIHSRCSAKKARAG